MKLIINYDFVEKVKDVKQPFGPLKIARNNKYRYAFYLSSWSIINIATSDSFPNFLSISLMDIAFIMGYMSVEMLMSALLKKDIYAEPASKKLMELSRLLNSAHINTDYDLLLNSELYKTEYKFDFNKEKLISIMQSKYVMVPIHSYNGEVKPISIVQEHVMGSNDYELSFGSPKRKVKFAYSNA